jgi:hypothetical protein
MNKRVFIFALFISLVSCQYFEKQVPDEQELFRTRIEKNQLG